LYLIKSPPLIRNFTRKKIYWQISTTEKRLYYTFDDGPIPEVTPMVLAILKKYKATATFFMVGENITKHPEIYHEVKAAGHAIGNHTYNHLKAFNTNHFTYYRNILKTKYIVPGKLFRPPHGQITPHLIKSLHPHFNIVLWSVLSADFDQSISPEKCLKNVIQNSKNGSIIVMHDSLKAQKNMIFALEESLKYFSNLGYTFHSLKHLE